MTIIDDLKQFIGYSSNDLDFVFAIVSLFIVIFFVSTFFNLINSAFGFGRGRRY